ncbi:hypothetical protein MKW98_021157 [Papaver atlanticum]|uniref:3'-5' exonuclease domain-containing protein n=1 Tax=Papaver atlanticum TaxID=357466 RepID=A0AAD4XU05_9MAGN|nr:hypothetical protein MKW98_021157 [Papaver atlanticum]
MSSTSSAKKHTSIEVVEKKTETHHTFKVKYYNDKIYTTVTHTASVVDQWIEGVDTTFAVKLKLENLVVGLDIERVRNNKVDFFGRDKNQVPKTLVDFLNDQRIKFVGAGIDFLADKILFGTRGLYQSELNSLVNIMLGKHLHHEPKFTRITLSRWDRDILKNEKVEYACLDAYTSSSHKRN